MSRGSSLNPAFKATHRINSLWVRPLRGQITIPKEIIDELDLKEGETLEIRVEDGKMVIVPTIAVAKDQAWFWNQEWQREEREVEEQIQDGRVSEPMDAGEALKFLDQLKE